MPQGAAVTRNSIVKASLLQCNIYYHVKLMLWLLRFSYPILLYILFVTKKQCILYSCKQAFSSGELQININTKFILDILVYCTCGGKTAAVRATPTRLWCLVYFLHSLYSLADLPHPTPHWMHLWSRCVSQSNFAGSRAKLINLKLKNSPSSIVITKRK